VAAQPTDRVGVEFVDLAEVGEQPVDGDLGAVAPACGGPVDVGQPGVRRAEDGGLGLGEQAGAAARLYGDALGLQGLEQRRVGDLPADQDRDVAIGDAGVVEHVDGAGDGVCLAGLVGELLDRHRGTDRLTVQPHLLGQPSGDRGSEVVGELHDRGPGPAVGEEPERVTSG
jgi:hypothetical protein